MSNIRNQHRTWLAMTLVIALASASCKDNSSSGSPGVQSLLHTADSMSRADASRDQDPCTLLSATEAEP
jgi:hypothetical protein